MHETPILEPGPAAPAEAPEPASEPPAVSRVTLSEIEVDAIARVNAMYRSAASSIIVSRGGDPNARWRPELDENGRIVAYSIEEKGA